MKTWRTGSLYLLLVLLAGPALAVVPDGAGAALPPEICDNAVDDDGDGLTDLNDPDCACGEDEVPSLIPNPSFEEINCCPATRTQLNCANDWIQASAATTDLVHTCGWLGFQGFPAPLPFPDGEAVVGFWNGRPANEMETTENLHDWKEYAGACLLGPLESGVRYRIELQLGFIDSRRSPPLDLTIFGTSDCKNLPFGDDSPTFGCPTNDFNWFRLGAVTVSSRGDGRWVKAAIDVEPRVDVRAVAIGPDCSGKFNSGGLYYFLDNLVLADYTAFPIPITPTPNPCANDFSLSFPPDAGETFQWYRDGIALVGETAPTLERVAGDGTYEVVFSTAGGVTCRRSQPFAYRRPVLYNQVSATVCANELYAFGERQLDRTGSYVDTFRSVSNCDSIVQLELERLVVTENTATARIFPGETLETGRYRLQHPGAYSLVLNSTYDCDSLVELELDYYQVYTPTAFSPNRDGVNDRFTLSGGPDLEEVLSLEIFDRWGNLVASGTEWDGRGGDGRPLAPGLFVYVARFRMDDGKVRQRGGSVVLVR